MLCVEKLGNIFRKETSMANDQVIFPNDSKIIDMDTRTIHIHGDIDQEMSKEISYNINKLDDSRLPITVKINSTGGLFEPVCSIITDLSNVNNEVIVDINGVAFSGAAMIALIGDYIRMSRFGQMMLHYLRWGTENQSLPEHRVDIEQSQEHFD